LIENVRAVSVAPTVTSISKEDPEPVEHLKNLESTIRDMKAAGFDYNT
jgi:hypothetical protein